MILSDVRRYLSENKKASLVELSEHFSVEQEAMRGMLEHLISKGLVSVVDSTPDEPVGCGINELCTGCVSSSILCDSSQKSEMFEWIDKDKS